MILVLNHIYGKKIVQEKFDVRGIWNQDIQSGSDLCRKTGPDLNKTPGSG